MDILDQAMHLHRAGRLGEAETLYRQILAQDPHHAQALQLTGLIACQRGDLAAAIDLITRAVNLDPTNAEFQINLGEVQRRQGRHAEAIATFRRAAALAPQNAFAHYNLAVALAGTGQKGDAIAAYRRALALQPAFPEALSNLGLLLHEAHEDQQAVDCLQQALALRPAHAETENSLGLALWSLHHYADALAAFTHAAALKPRFADAHANRARALRKLGRGRDAVTAFQTAADLNPASADIHRDLALALMETASFDQALAAAHRAVELAPTQAEAHHALGEILAAAHRAAPAQHALAPALAAYEQALALQHAAEWEFELAVLRGLTPPTAPDAYVRTLFDEYAPRFENHLVEGLNYRVPEQLRATVRQIWQSQNTPPQNLDILDLGSGTGRVGELFRPHARTLTGVDLAPHMIALAQNRRDPAGRPIYDRLLTSHLLPALQQFDRAYDLILAADVFIYVGSLDAVLPAAACALRPGGLLAFSLERYDPPSDASPSDTHSLPGFDFHLRFRHALSYIRTLAAASNLLEIAAIASPLRNDVPPGWLVVLQRPAAS
jgi:predicted TPR repeat methyltransferase